MTSADQRIIDFGPMTAPELFILSVALIVCAPVYIPLAIASKLLDWWTKPRPLYSIPREQNSEGKARNPDSYLTSQ